jgi:DNA-binding response OmpR family regulator
MPIPHTALLVDDDPTTLDSVRELLPWQKVRVEMASDPDAAIDCLKKTHYCGLIVDLTLDRSCDVLLHLSEQHIEIPVVVISLKYPEFIRDLPIAPAIKLVLRKPLDPSLLASVILGLCGIAV